MTLVNIAAAVLSEMGLKTSVLKCSSPAAGFHAAIMDKNVIVARGFRFDQYRGLT